MTYKAATLPLRRRLIGALIVVAGALVVAVGFFTTLTPNASGTAAQQNLIVDGHALSLTSGSGTPADALRHIVDHGVTTTSTIQTMADFAFRTGIVAMAAAGIFGLALLLGPMRGLIGLAAGIGLLGLAVCTAVTAGESAALSTASNGTLHTDVGTGVVVLALGFVAIMAGGALAALRPLAGLVSGISLAVLSVFVGIVLALVVGGDHLATQAPNRQGGTSLVLGPPAR